MNKKTLSIVIPVYYNSGSIRELYSELTKIADAIAPKVEIIFVDDGSGDDSFEIIDSISSKDKRVTGIKLSRNFGSFVACLAGLAHCKGDSAVVISADLQDPPELIPMMYEKWIEGNKIVMAVRTKRKENLFKVAASRMFYMLFRFLVTKDMPKGGFDFVLVDRQVIDILTAIQEKNTTLIGLILWVGFKRAEVHYTKNARKHGKSRWTLLKKINYSIDSILAFSLLPLRLMSIAGIILAISSFLGIAYVMTAYFLGWMPIAGWPSLMVVNLFMFGCLFLSLGIIGEYIWRNLEETRRRPLFIVDCYSNKDDSK
jgi:dolichol-phosphate mannosyltransferase